MVSPVHANFIVNAGGATADQVMDLVDRVRERVGRVHGVAFELEVELISPIAMEANQRFAIREGGRTVGAGAIIAVED